MKNAKKQAKGRWVASRVRPFGDDWECWVYNLSHPNAHPMVNVLDVTRAECRTRAAAIRDMANAQGWR